LNETTETTETTEATMTTMISVKFDEETGTLILSYFSTLYEFGYEPREI
jgi:hypothetical protein